MELNDLKLTTLKDIFITGVVICKVLRERTGNVQFKNNVAGTS